MQLAELTAVKIFHILQHSSSPAMQSFQLPLVTFHLGCLQTAQTQGKTSFFMQNYTEL